jgi:hypothetical protein
MAAQIGPSGLDTTLQANLGGNKVALWMPPGGATTVPGVFGMAALTATGTATARTVATTNLLTRMTRLGYVSAATAGALAGAREAVAKFTTGAGPGLGGFFARYRFGISDAATVAGARMFVGLDALTAAPTNIDPSTKVNCVGVGQIAAHRYHHHILTDRDYNSLNKENGGLVIIISDSLSISIHSSLLKSPFCFNGVLTMPSDVISNL